jgi:uncharacterized membrane protein
MSTGAVTVLAVCERDDTGSVPRMGSRSFLCHCTKTKPAIKGALGWVWLVMLVEVNNLFITYLFIHSVFIHLFITLLFIHLIINWVVF